MPKLKVMKLDPRAILPTVGHPGEDLAYDLYALEDTLLYKGITTAVNTGIAALFIDEDDSSKKYGLLIHDRSSMAIKGITRSAGVLDAGYIGHIKVMLTSYERDFEIKAGHKIAQIIPHEVFTSAKVEEVFELRQTSRGEGGFGSTGL